MIRFFLLVFILSINALFATQSTDKGDAKFSVRFKTLSFNEDFNDIYYFEGKEVKSVNINQISFSPEVFYSGKPELEFIRLAIEKSSPSEGEMIQKNQNDSLKKLEVVGDEINKVSIQLKNIYDLIASQDREPNSSEKITISDLNNTLQELAIKMKKAELDVAESNARHFASINRPEPTKVDSKTLESKKNPPSSAPKYEPFAKFPIPSSGGSYILIFNKTPNGVTISPINDAPGVFPFGSYQFFNLAGTPVELRFGSKVISLSPNGRTVFKPEIANGEYLEGEFWTKVDDEFKLGYKFRNLHISRVRTLAFIMPTAPGQSALNLKIAEERGQVESPPAEKPKSKDKKDKESEKKENENRPFG